MPLWKILPLWSSLHWSLASLAGSSKEVYIFRFHSTDAFILPVSRCLCFMWLLLLRSNSDERCRPSQPCWPFCRGHTFWAIFKQNGSALNTWASRYTERHVKRNPGKVLSSLKLTETIRYTKDSVTQTDDQFRKIKLDGKEVKNATILLILRTSTKMTPR